MLQRSIQSIGGVSWYVYWNDLSSVWHVWHPLSSIYPRIFMLNWYLWLKKIVHFPGFLLNFLFSSRETTSGTFEEVSAIYLHPSVDTIRRLAHSHTPYLLHQASHRPKPTTLFLFIVILSYFVKKKWPALLPSYQLKQLNQQTHFPTCLK